MLIIIMRIINRKKNINTSFSISCYHFFQPNPVIQTFRKAWEPCYNKGNWKNGRYIAQDEKQDCRVFVKKVLKNNPSKSWLFVGDSTMNYLFNQIQTRPSLNCHVIKKCDKQCTVAEYIYLPVSAHKRRACKVRGPCRNQMNQCRHNVNTVEYILTDFARDSKVAGSNKTVYQLLDWYLSNTSKDVCVLNIGMHDNGHNATDDQYVQGVSNLLSHFQPPHCSSLIWISINNVLGLKKFGQSNTKILRWNRLVEEMLKEEYPDTAYIDIYPMSTQKKMHKDNVHLDKLYYKTLAGFFL